MIKPEIRRFLLNKSYYGFEDILDGFRDVEECVHVLPGEFSGTVRITVEYIPSEEEQ